MCRKIDSPKGVLCGRVRKLARCQRDNELTRSAYTSESEHPSETPVPEGTIFILGPDMFVRHGVLSFAGGYGATLQLEVPSARGAVITARFGSDPAGGEPHPRSHWTIFSELNCTYAYATLVAFWCCVAFVLSGYLCMIRFGFVAYSTGHLHGSRILLPRSGSW